MSSNGGIHALTVFDDGGGAALYAAGEFTSAGGVPANHIAKWNGKSWSALGAGLTPPSQTGYDAVVFSLTVFDDGNGPALYAGGRFNAAGGAGANNIAKWDGSAWSALGLGMTYAVGAMAVFDDGHGPALYAGGGETLAWWNPGAPGSWSPVGFAYADYPGYGRPTIQALTAFDDGGGPALYVGGHIAWAGGVSANGIAKWDGTTWSALGCGVQEGNYDYYDYLTAVHAAAVFDDGTGPALYAGGDFTVAGNAGASRIAKWKDSSWSSLSRGLGIMGSLYRPSLKDFNYPSVNAMQVFDDGSGLALYVGGFFYTAGAVRAHSIAKWNGSTWSTVGGGLYKVFALTTFDDGNGPGLYAASGHGVYKWGGTSWSLLGPAMSWDVYALTVFDDGSGPALYAAGHFTTAGGVQVNSIAKWNPGTPGTWSGLGSGISVPSYADHGGVHALTVFDDGSGPALYAGGLFIAAGNVSVNNIAKWDGTSWSPLGAGVGGDCPYYSYDPCVSDLTVFDDGSGTALYAAGAFTMAGEASANHIAKWDGTNWSSLGTGPSSGCALAVFDDGSGPALYCGLSKWSGTTWSTLGNATGGANALAGFDDGSGPALYAGGAVITTEGRVSALFAKWSCVRRGDMNQDSAVDLSDFALFL